MAFTKRTSQAEGFDDYHNCNLDEHSWHGIQILFLQSMGPLTMWQPVDFRQYNISTLSPRQSKNRMGIRGLHQVGTARLGSDSWRNR